MQTCYDCLNLRCKLPVKDGKIKYNRASAWCRKGNLTKGDLLQRKYFQYVIPERPKIMFQAAERCIDFDDLRED